MVHNDVDNALKSDFARISKAYAAMNLHKDKVAAAYNARNDKDYAAKFFVVEKSLEECLNRSKAGYSFTHDEVRSLKQHIIAQELRTLSAREVSQKYGISTSTAYRARADASKVVPVDFTRKTRKSNVVAIQDARDVQAKQTADGYTPARTYRSDIAPITSMNAEPRQDESASQDDQTGAIQPVSPSKSGSAPAVDVDVNVSVTQQPQEPATPVEAPAEPAQPKQPEAALPPAASPMASGAMNAPPSENAHIYDRNADGNLTLTPQQSTERVFTGPDTFAIKRLNAIAGKDLSADELDNLTRGISIDNVMTHVEQSTGRKIADPGAFQDAAKKYIKISAHVKACETQRAHPANIAEANLMAYGELSNDELNILIKDPNNSMNVMTALANRSQDAKGWTQERYDAFLKGDAVAYRQTRGSIERSREDAAALKEGALFAWGDLSDARPMPDIKVNGEALKVARETALDYIKSDPAEAKDVLNMLMAAHAVQLGKSEDPFWTADNQNAWLKDAQAYAGVMPAAASVAAAPVLVQAEKKQPLSGWKKYVAAGAAAVALLAGGYMLGSKGKVSDAEIAKAVAAQKAADSAVLADMQNKYEAKINDALADLKKQANELEAKLADGQKSLKNDFDAKLAQAQKDADMLKADKIAAEKKAASALADAKKAKDEMATILKDPVAAEKAAQALKAEAAKKTADAAAEQKAADDKKAADAKKAADEALAAKQAEDARKAAEVAALKKAAQDAQKNFDKEAADLVAATNVADAALKVVDKETAESVAATKAAEDAQKVAAKEAVEAAAAKKAYVDAEKTVAKEAAEHEAAKKVADDAWKAVDKAGANAVTSAPVAEVVVVPAQGATGTAVYSSSEVEGPRTQETTITIEKTSPAKVDSNGERVYTSEKQHVARIDRASGVFDAASATEDTIFDRVNVEADDDWMRANVDADGDTAFDRLAARAVIRKQIAESLAAKTGRAPSGVKLDDMLRSALNNEYFNGVKKTRSKSDGNIVMGTSVSFGSLDEQVDLSRFNSKFPGLALLSPKSGSSVQEAYNAARSEEEKAVIRYVAGRGYGIQAEGMLTAAQHAMEAGRNHDAFTYALEAVALAETAHRTSKDEAFDKGAKELRNEAKKIMLKSGVMSETKLRNAIKELDAQVTRKISDEVGKGIRGDLGSDIFRGIYDWVIAPNVPGMLMRGHEFTMLACPPMASSPAQRMGGALTLEQSYALMQEFRAKYGHFDNFETKFEKGGIPTEVADAGLAVLIDAAHTLKSQDGNISLQQLVDYHSGIWASKFVANVMDKDRGDRYKIFDKAGDLLHDDAQDKYGVNASFLRALGKQQLQTAKESQDYSKKLVTMLQIRSGLAIFNEAQKAVRWATFGVNAASPAKPAKVGGKGGLTGGETGGNGIGPNGGNPTGGILGGGEIGGNAIVPFGE